MTNLLKTLTTIETNFSETISKIASNANVTSKDLLDLYNAISESLGGKTLKKFKSKTEATERATLILANFKTELEKAKAADVKAKADKDNKKDDKKSAPKATSARKSTAIMATVNGAEIKLVNSVSTKIFAGVEKIEVDKELSETAYFNAAWFAKRKIEVVVKKPAEATE